LWKKKQKSATKSNESLCGFNWQEWCQQANKRRGCHLGRKLNQTRGGCFVSRVLPIALKVIVAILFIKLLVCVISGRACLFPIAVLGAAFLFFGKKLRRRFLGRNCGKFNNRCPLSNLCQQLSNDQQVPEAEVVRVEKKEEQQIKEEEVEEEVPIQQVEPVEQEVVEAKVVVQGNKKEGSSFSKGLKQLEEMGFLDRDRNIAVLVQNRGNVVNAVRDLLA